MSNLGSLAGAAVRLPALLLVSAGLALGSVQVEIAGNPPLLIVDARLEGEQAILRSEDGRLFTVPRSVPGIEALVEDLASTRGFEAAPLSIDEIVALLESGVPEETLLVYTETHRIRHALSKEDLRALRRAGASDAFIHSLMARLPVGGTGARSTRWKAYIFTEGLQREDEAGREAEALPEEAQPPSEGIPFFPFLLGGPGLTQPFVGPHLPCPTCRSRPEEPRAPPDRASRRSPTETTDSAGSGAIARPTTRTGKPAASPPWGGVLGTGGGSSPSTSSSSNRSSSATGATGGSRRSRQ